MLVSQISAVMLAATALVLLTGGVAAADEPDRPILLGHVPNPARAIDELPAPPLLVAPKAEPHRSRPPTVTFTWGGTAPVFRKPATPAGLKALKAK